MWPWSYAEQPLLLTGDQDTSPKVKIMEVPVMLYYAKFNIILINLLYLFKDCSM